MTIIEKLEIGRARIAKGWCKGGYGRTVNGEPISALNPECTQWCILGALQTMDPFAPVVGSYLIQVLPEGCENSLVVFNDRVAKSAQDILDLFDRAIALARSEGVS